MKNFYFIDCYLKINSEVEEIFLSSFSKFDHFFSFTILQFRTFGVHKEQLEYFIYFNFKNVTDIML